MNGERYEVTLRIVFLYPPVPESFSITSLYTSIGLFLDQINNQFSISYSLGNRMECFLAIRGNGECNYCTIEKPNKLQNDGFLFKNAVMVSTTIKNISRQCEI